MKTYLKPGVPASERPEGTEAVDSELVAHRRRQLVHCLAEYAEVQFAYLHGSVLEGLPYHDLDVALYLDPSNPAACNAYDYEMRRSVELTLALRFPVDVQVLNRAPLGFQHSAVQGELLLVRHAERLADYLEYVALRYMEFAALGRAYLLDVLQG